MNPQSYTEQEWQSLHEEIQERFRTLAAEVQAVAPAAEPRFGKTVTKRFPLFSHVSFPLVRAGTCNDIIVGVDIGPDDGQWRIDADISDEEEGTIYFELPRTPFSAATFDELRGRVLATTDELISRGKPVLLRLFGAPAPVVAHAAASFPEIAPKA